MLGQYWASVIDDGPLVYQDWINTLCLSGHQNYANRNTPFGEEKHHQSNKATKI